MSARWLPTDRVEVDASGDITQQDQENPAETLLYANKPTITVAATNTATGATAFLPYSSTFGAVDPLAESLYELRGVLHAGVPGSRKFAYRAIATPGGYSAPDNFPVAELGHPGHCEMGGRTRPLALTSILGFRGYSSSWYHDGDASLWPLQLRAGLFCSITSSAR